ncbi:MAG: protease modulator HflC, partial [Desulfobulbaceae bacterium]|nr:protease modulator HflC [Desulfobulbaceae bacterium]
NQIPTYDKTYIYMDSTARWRITDALLFMRSVGDINRAQSMLDDIINGALRDIVNKNNLIEVIRSSDWSPEYMISRPEDKNQPGRPEFGRDKISEMVLEAASKLTPRYGIELMDVMFKRVNYIESVRQRIYQRMISERKRIAAEKRSLGEGSKAEILGDVDKELKEITSTAKRKATEIKGTADAKASKIYAEAYSKHPEFYSFLKSLESYRDILGDNTSLILSSDTELFQYLQSQKRQ